MKLKQLFCLLLALLLLTGCGKPQELPAQTEETPVTEPDTPTQPEITTAPGNTVAEHTYAPSLTLPEADPVYIYSNDTHTVVVSPDGEIVMENTDGTLEPLKDNQTGEIVGLLVQQQEGFQTDEWGSVSPLREWCDLYDLSGQFLMEVPLSYVSAYGDYLYGFDRNTLKSKVYSRTAKTMLYDNVVLFAPLGEHYYVAQDVWGSPGIILTADGQELARTPAEYAIESVLASRYLVTRQNDLCGLLDETGQEVLPCQYSEIRSVSGTLVEVLQDGRYTVLDLTTGEAVFQWNYPIEIILPETMVVQIDDQYSGCMLVTYDGTPLMDDYYDWINAVTYDDAGMPTLLCGTRYDDTTTQYIYFTPDGTVVNTIALQNGYGQLISDKTILLTTSQWDDETQTSYGTMELRDIYTGEIHFTAEGRDVSAYPMYADLLTGEGQEEGYIILSAPNAQGWPRQTVVHESGQEVLQEYQDLVYVGGGVVQCTRGFTGGLLRLDGLWLYEEPAFSGLNEQ